jgi:hypothetical protein
MTLFTSLLSPITRISRARSWNTAFRSPLGSGGLRFSTRLTSTTADGLRPTRSVVDFVNAPLSVRQAGAPQAIAKLADDPWAAALVAQHGLTVYSRFRVEPEWGSFFSTMEAARAGALRTTGLPLDDLTADYTFVRLGDLISLAFCTGWTDEERFGEWTVQLSGTRVVVRPDAFGGALIPIEISAKEVRNQAFRSDAELHDELRQAKTTTLRGDVGEMPR